MNCLKMKNLKETCIMLLGGDLKRCDFTKNINVFFIEYATFNINTFIYFINLTNIN